MGYHRQHDALLQPQRGESAEGERQADSLLEPRDISAAVREHLCISFRKVTP